MDYENFGGGCDCEKVVCDPFVDSLLATCMLHSCMNGSPSDVRVCVHLANEIGIDRKSTRLNSSH